MQIMHTGERVLMIKNSRKLLILNMTFLSKKKLKIPLNYEKKLTLCN